MISSQDEIIKAPDALILAQEISIAKLRERVHALENQVGKLEQRLGLDSRTSSKPPPQRWREETTGKRWMNCDKENI